MRTIYGSLAFYDSTLKQDVDRIKAIIPVHCPRTQLPPFQFALESDSIATVDRIELLDKTYDGTEETVAADWIADTGFDTFTNTGLEISSAINAAGVCFGSSTAFSTIRGTQIRFIGTLTLNSGSAPMIFIINDGGTPVTLSEGANNIILTATSVASSAQLAVYVNGATNYELSGVSITTITGALDITDFFPTLPQPYDPTDTTFDPYLKYNGDVLNWLLPLGIYYLKITGDSYIYYSDYIRVDNIYPNLISSLSNISYETFSSSKTRIVNAVNTTGSGNLQSGDISIRRGEQITMVLYLTVTSGQSPTTVLWSDAEVSNVSNIVVLSAGLNVVTFTATMTVTDAELSIYVTAASQFSTSEIVIIRQYSANFIKINFRNTHNFGNLLFEDSQTQIAWLEAVLNNPTHEMVNVGEEKDGIFIAEKIVSKYNYAIICYISRVMYQCLIRLPQHNTVTITDEVGNTYTPAIGNITVDPIDWITYETGKLIIRFNDGDNTAFSWTDE